MLEKLEHGEQIKFHPCLADLPDPRAVLKIIGSEIDSLTGEAEEIVQGKVRLFGSQLVPLVLTPPIKLDEWTKYESGDSLIDGQDIKYVWEASRLGWAYKLAMAYHLSKDERFADAFWKHIEEFIAANPPYKGPNWASAQEVAVRLVALAFAIQVFAQSEYTTPERIELITKTIAIHAERIPPTMLYARSQNNNHLISEALGLCTASTVLPDHPLALKWRTLGWKWLNHAFITQISSDGTYSQHSTNYHRLMLQCALWAYTINQPTHNHPLFARDVLRRLQAATNWLWKQTDPDTGQVPNLGHNDGAYLMPLSICPYNDFRPVLNAAIQAFLQTRQFPKGQWDDMSVWLCIPEGRVENQSNLNSAPLRTADDHEIQPPYILANRKSNSWAAFHVMHFYSRPAHADQLHLDLWWHGLNIAQDAGTYFYNALPPWDNSLTSAFVHNTVTVDHREFMHRASRFLYLDWAQGKVVDRKSSVTGELGSITAQHDGYRQMGITHTRTINTFDDGHWEVIDILEGKQNRSHTAQLHWLLPDWEYELKELVSINGFMTYEIGIRSPHGLVRLKLGEMVKNPQLPQTTQFQIARAGMLLTGSGSVAPITGWTSPTYGNKMPALACIIQITHELPIELKSEWYFPVDG